MAHWIFLRKTREDALLLRLFREVVFLVRGFPRFFGKEAWRDARLRVSDKPFAKDLRRLLLLPLELVAFVKVPNADCNKSACFLKRNGFFWVSETFA